MLTLRLPWVTVFSTMLLLLQKWPKRDGMFRGNHDKEYLKMLTISLRVWYLHQPCTCDFMNCLLVNAVIGFD